MAAQLPTGTVTFLFTDIEGSTRLRQAQPEAFDTSLALHHALLRQAIEGQGGFVFKIIGDAFCAAFATAPAGTRAALDAQRALHSAEWGSAALRVRMALHTGTAELLDSEYEGFTLARVARLLSAGHGGQVLLSQTTADLVRDDLPPDTILRDLGDRRLKDLVQPEHISQLTAPDLPDRFPPLKTLELHPHNLPVQLTSFVGRDKEIADARRLLGVARLLTLIGPGGTGKTRLSLQVAAEVLEGYADGAWLVELADQTDPTLVPQVVASALALREDANRPLLKLLEDYARGKQLLLILDNCEHLLDACARLADQLLHAAPGLRILATSREGLGIAGETTYRVQALSVPEPGALPSPASLTQYEAVRLFIDRAAAADPGFVVDAANAPAVAQICYRLDGIPLAIELAAARTRHLRLEELLARLDDRLRLLTGGSRTALPRQQTLRATLDWSHDLLSAEERQVFRRLAVFGGGATLAAAEQVCSGPDLEPWQVLDLLGGLVGKSLVVLDQTTAAQGTRYRMLETLRQYAYEKLQAAGEVEETRTRHLEHCLALADEAEPHLWRAEQLEWLGRYDAEQDNFRAALDYSLAARPSLAPHLAAQLYRYWELRGLWREGFAWLRRAVEVSDGLQPDKWLARAAFGLARLFYYYAPTREAEALAQRAHEIAGRSGDRWSLARAMMVLGFAADADGRRAEAKALHEAALAEFEASGDQWGQGWAIVSLGWLAVARGDAASVALYADQALALYQSIGERHGLIAALDLKVNLAHDAGDYSLEVQLMRQQLVLAQELGDPMRVNAITGLLGKIAYFLGDLAEARRQLVETVTTSRPYGDTFGLANSQLDLGVVASLQGQHADADACYNEANRLSKALDDKYIWAGTYFCGGLMAYYQGSLAQAAELHRKAWTLYRELDHKSHVGMAAYALAQTLLYSGELDAAAELVEAGLAYSRGVYQRGVNLLLGVRGRLALARGDLGSAEADLRESLSLRQRAGAKRDMAEALEWVAQLAARQAQPLRAARLLGAAEALREQIGAPVPQVEQPDIDQALALIRRQASPEDFELAWNEGRALTREQAVAYALADRK